MKILVTGCFGFIGLNFIEHVSKKNPKIKIVGIDCITYASNKKYIKKFINLRNFKFYKVNINSKKINEIIIKEKPLKIINFAAESHVDNSITKPDKFIKSNINGVFNLLYYSNLYFQKLDTNLKKKFIFLQVSTDEVFGSVTNISAKENSKYNPSSPYSASKASADHLVNAWKVTYNFPVIITHTCNNYGPYQNKEKFIPKIIMCLLKNSEIPLYGNGQNIREWIYVKDHVKILLKLLFKSPKNQSFNIGTNVRYSNKELINIIIKSYCKIKKIKNYKKYYNNIVNVNDRLGHDYRYALNSSKIKKMFNVKNNTNFKVGIIKTIKYFMEDM